MPCRADWRRLPERQSLRTLAAALRTDEARVRACIDEALTEQDATLAVALRRLPHAQAQQEARLAFAAQVLKICADELAARDARMLELVAGRGADGFRALRTLGELVPPCMPWETLGVPAALRRLGAVLEHTRETRGHELAQRLARDVSVQRGRDGTGQPPAELAHADVQRLLSAHDVQRLREGAPLVVDPSPAWATPDEMREAEAELRAFICAQGLTSSSSCNTRAVTSSMPLLGDGYELKPGTRRLLRLLAAVPALIESHGWPRRLVLPPLLQLASYSAGSGARYTRHFDSNPWEQANRREITILLYVNHGWDAERSGGCLRLHPSDGGAELDGPRDVSPVGGRLVIFQSALQAHEVLPCSAGERIALTLWLEHAA